MCGLGSRHGFKLINVVVLGFGFCASGKSATVDVCGLGVRHGLKPFLRQNPCNLIVRGRVDRPTNCLLSFEPRNSGPRGFLVIRKTNVL